MIGNQDYAHAKLRGLLYPEQDAADVAEALTNLNFKVRHIDTTSPFADLLQAVETTCINLVDKKS